MPSFIEDLWSSVFTPGPTPTLLVATNATFAALQIVLFLLFVATYSIHFVVLSFLSAALWWSINWFAREVRLEQARQEEEKRKQENVEQESSELIDSANGNESETETEVTDISKARRRRVAPAGEKSNPSVPNVPMTKKPGDVAQAKRETGEAESSGYTSTDSEWEKVDRNKTA